MKIQDELKRRSGLIGGDPAIFDKCELVLFDVYGVDPEQLCDLWAEQPFLGGPPLVTGDSGESVGEGVDAMDAVEETVEVLAVGESMVDTLARDVQIAMLEKLRKQSQLLDIQIEIATLDLANKRKCLSSIF